MPLTACRKLPPAAAAVILGPVTDRQVGGRGMNKHLECSRRVSHTRSESVGSYSSWQAQVLPPVNRVKLSMR